MGAERWIVFLLLATLGGGIYIMSYLVDEESIQKYGERVAEYNAEHDETMMDAALHRMKRGPEKKRLIDSKLNRETGSELVKNAGMADHPYSENDRIMLARINDGEDVDTDAQGYNFHNVEREKENHSDHLGTARSRRSSGQGINEEDPDQPYPETARARRSSGQGINEEDPDRPYPETARARRSSGQGIIEEDPDRPYPETARARRSSGQGINEEDPEQPYPGTKRARRSSGQGINEEDPEQPYPEIARARRSSGQGINEEDPEQPYPETARARRSSGQGINEEDPDPPYPGTARARRSSGQGINEEDPEQPYPETARARRSSGQGINEEDPEHSHRESVNTKSVGVRESKSQGTTNHIETQDHIDPPLIALLFESSEDHDGQEQSPSSSEEFLENQLSGASSNKGENSGLALELGQSSEESYEKTHSFQQENINPYEQTNNMPSSENPERLSHLSRHLLSDDSDKKLITFNKGIDFILGLMNAMFSLEGEVSVPLPFLNKTFGHGIMQGTFLASQGFFKNPATLHRTGDVAVVKHGDSVGLEVALGLETLEAGYGHYDLKILKILQNGTLEVSIAENSIKMKISLTYYPNCKVDVKYLELDKLDGIKIDISGLGPFQSMFDMLSKWLLHNFTTDLKNIVNKKLIEKAKKAVAREDICKYFPLNLIPN